MPRAVRFDQYGGIDVLHVAEVERPSPGPGQVLVAVKAAAVNPGEAAIREGRMHERAPARFPSGQGSDLAGVVEEVGPGVDRFAPGDEVLGYTYGRASQAEYVVTEVDKLTARPPGVPWDVAGSLFIAGAAAYAAVRAVAPQEGERVIVAGAAGGVGSIAAQLARNAGATVIGLASEPNHEWLADHGIVPVDYHEGVADRIRELAPGEPIDGFVDAFGDGYVELALLLGVPPQRVATVIDVDAAERFGVTATGDRDADTPDVLAELAAMADDGRLDVPIAAVYPLDEVQIAYRQLEERHTRGKIVLRPQAESAA
jgi:NADPH:quinone reductase-like Zn-dependent oxidoreductase